MIIFVPEDVFEGSGNGYNRSGKRKSDILPTVRRSVVFETNDEQGA